MADPRAAIMLWSGGKDSMMALDSALADPTLHIEALVTTVTGEYDRISMHGVRRELLEAQAVALGIPLLISEIPPACTNDVYEAALANTVVPLREAGVTHVVAGDLFLTEIREYRERAFGELGLETLFPLWGENTTELAHRFIASGAVTTLCCIDPTRIDRSFAGRRFNEQLLQALPAGVDPCGENGEFHTFVSDGPRFGRALNISVSDRVERGGFVFADLVLNSLAGKGDRPEPTSQNSPNSL